MSVVHAPSIHFLKIFDEENFMQLRFVLNNKKKEIHLSYLCIVSFFIMDLQINDKPLLKSKRETF